MRESNDVVEREGVEVSRAYVSGAHVALVCDDDATRLPVSVAAVRAITTAPILAVHTKSDLDLPVEARAPGVQGLTPTRDSDAGIAGPVRVSAVTREGLVELMGCLDGVLEARYGGAVDPEMPILARARHAAALESAQQELRLFMDAWRNGTVPVSVAAVHVRSSVHALESLIGAVDVEDVLARVFSSFCIGK